MAGIICSPRSAKIWGGQSPPPPWFRQPYLGEARSTFARARLTLGLIFMGLARKKKITEGFFIDDLGASPSRQFWTKSVRCTLRVSKFFKLSPAVGSFYATESRTFYPKNERHPKFNENMRFDLSTTLTA